MLRKGTVGSLFLRQSWRSRQDSFSFLQAAFLVKYWGKRQSLMGEFNAGDQLDDLMVGKGRI